MTIQPNPGAQVVTPLTGKELLDVLAGPTWGTATTADAADTALVTQSATAVGTNRATALVLTTQITNITTAAASTGVVLPAAVKVGQRVTLYNNGASAITVYGNGSDTIDGTAGATGVTLTNALRCMYTCVQSGKWISAQLGAVSA